MKKIILALLIVSSLHAGKHDDKIAHAMAGTMIYGMCIIGKGALEDALGYEVKYLNYKTCVIPVIIAGVGKELYDANHDGHTSEFLDAVATVAIPIGVSYTIYEW